MFDTDYIQKGQINTADPIKNFFILLVVNEANLGIFGKMELHLQSLKDTIYKHERLITIFITLPFEKNGQ